MSEAEWRTIFDNMDTAEKVGYPYISFHNASGEQLPSHGKCAYCEHPMIILEDRGSIMCPYCRRQLAIDAPKEQKLSPNLQMETGEAIDNSPAPSGTQFDWRKYPGMITKDY